MGDLESVGFEKRGRVRVCSRATEMVLRSAGDTVTWMDEEDLRERAGQIWRGEDVYSYDRVQEEFEFSAQPRSQRSC